MKMNTGYIDDEVVNKTITTRIDATTRLLDNEKSSTPPFPKAVKIEVTNLCNLKCWFCASKDQLRPQKFMDFDLYKTIIDKCYDAGIREAGLFYLGEPLLYPHLVEAVKYAKDKGMTYVFFTTNGLLLNEKLLRDLINAGLDSIKFSLNAFSDDDMKQATQVAGYTKQVENLKMTRRIRDEMGASLRIYASCINRINDELQEKQEEAYETWKPYTDEQYWLPLYNQASFIKGEHLKIVGGNRGRRDNLRCALPCWAIFKTCHITVDGLMSACCFDHNGHFVMGDLKTQTFEECWNSDRYQWLRQCHLDGKIEGTPCAPCHNK